MQKKSIDQLISLAQKVADSSATASNAGVDPDALTRAIQSVASQLSATAGDDPRIATLVKKITDLTPPFSSLADLIEFSKREKWCTKPVCTTCGAIPFRKALRAMKHEDVISGLRSLPDEFLHQHSDMFRLIISEISFFGIGGELLEPLEGTPAAFRLQKLIDYQNAKRAERDAYRAEQTPEAIAKRKAQKKLARQVATSPHRDRKESTLDAVRNITTVLNSLPSERLLAEIYQQNFEISKAAIGGLIFKRISEYYRTHPISGTDLELLKNLSNSHSGYWKKLLQRLTA